MSCSVLEKIADAARHNVAATCPKCHNPFGVPRSRFGQCSPSGADELVCAACGSEWTEADPEEIAAAWYGDGASEKASRLSDAMLANQLRVDRERKRYADAMSGERPL